MQNHRVANYIKNLFFVIILMFTSFSFAGKTESPAAPATSLSSLIQFGLENSLDSLAVRAETRYQQSNGKVVNQNRLIPQINLSASYQKIFYDRLRDDGSGTGRLVSNNGQNTPVSLTLSYDLQKLFGPDSELVKQSIYNARLQEKIIARDIIRSIKKSYFTIIEIQTEIEELNKLIGLFERIENILQKQKKIGISNELERQQFQVQQSILDTDLQTRKSDLDAVYFQLSTVVNLDISALKDRLSLITDKTEYYIPGSAQFDSEHMAKLKDYEMLENLGRDYNIAKLEYDKFNSVPLPSFFLKGSRDSSSVLSSDGPQTTTEIGITIPLDSLFNRPAQKSQLGAKSEKTQAIFQKALLDYRNQIRLNMINLIRFKNQTESLKQTRNQTKKLLDKSFLYYSQRRIDVLGTLDIFQKYLQAARNSLLSELQMRTTDAELEYLVGGASL